MIDPNGFVDDPEGMLPNGLVDDPEGILPNGSVDEADASVDGALDCEDGVPLEAGVPEAEAVPAFWTINCAPVSMSPLVAYPK